MNHEIIIHDVMPKHFPLSWASDWGEDQIGLWMAFTYRGVRQCFRWIRPGIFMMGSPDDEPERIERETLHRVTLTQGYWLAETACTQALWQIVMGENPSEFKEEQNPVETVSWNDVQDFLTKFNNLKSGLDFRLPTEAEWEFACRAGTSTPFSFGENITPEQVNYNGEYPYADGEKGIMREKTVPVKSLPQNQWGLYEMHGNVWEWCADYYDEYQLEQNVDPTGVDKGANRVLRGGSWFYYGRNVRSAYRNRLRPDARGINSIGFRLGRGH